jgi:hypothetical protein
MEYCTLTMMVAWDQFNMYERRAIAKWLSENGKPVTMGTLPFVTVGEVWKVLMKMEAAMRHTMPSQKWTPATERFRTTLLIAVNNHLENQTSGEPNA